MARRADPVVASDMVLNLPRGKCTMAKVILQISFILHAAGAES